MPSICSVGISQGAVDVKLPLAEMNYARTDRAAEELGLAVITLKKWRKQGKGPVFVKRGARVLYPVAELIA